MENSNWKNKYLILGEMYENTRKEIFFEATDDIKGIKKIEPGCGCTKAKYDEENKMLDVIYEPGSVPHHIRIREGSEGYKSVNFVKVYYDDNTIDELIFEIFIRIKE